MSLSATLPYQSLLPLDPCGYCHLHSHNHILDTTSSSTVTSFPQSYLTDSTSAMAKLIYPVLLTVVCPYSSTHSAHHCLTCLLVLKLQGVFPVPTKGSSFTLPYSSLVASWLISSLFTPGPSLTRQTPIFSPLIAKFSLDPSFVYAFVYVC